MSKLLNRSLTIGGENKIVGTPAVTVLEYDLDANVYRAKGATKPTDGDAGYAIGCIFIKTDGGVATTVYANEGTATSCDFNVLNSSGGSTKYDDIGDPDANGSITFAGYTNTWLSTLDTGTVFNISNTDAALAGQTNILDLKFADDGEANGIFLRCLDNSGADVKFTIGADGATIIAGKAAGTDALTLTAGDITIAGAMNIAADNQDLTLGVSGATDSRIYFDGAGNLTFYDSATGVVKTLSQLAGTGLTNPTITGDMTMTDGQFIWTDTIDETAGTWVFATTSGTALSITADGITSGDILKIVSSTAGMTTGDFIACNNGSSDVFRVSLYGELNIAGNAGIDIITIAAGNFQMTDGNADLDEGVITVDSTADETNHFKRNHATSTKEVVLIEQTHTGATGEALALVQSATGNAKTLVITSAGDHAIVDISASAARTGDVIDIAMANMLAQRALLVDGAWTGVSGEGLVELAVTGNLAQNANMLRLTSTGAIQTGASLGYAIYVKEEGAAQAGSYAVYIESTNNEAINVKLGNVKLEDTLTLSGVTTTTKAIDITIADTEDDVGLTVTQNDVTNDLNAVEITSVANSNPGIALNINSNWKGLGIETSKYGATIVQDIIGGYGLHVSRGVASSATQLVTFRTTNVGDTGGNLLLDTNGDETSLSIDSEATDAVVIDIDAPAATIGDIFRCNDANALTTGGILNLVSNSADTGTRSLVIIHNDNTLAVGTTALAMTQDSTNYGLHLNQVGVLAAGKAGLYVTSATAQVTATGYLAYLYNSSTSSTSQTLVVKTAGTGAADNVWFENDGTGYNLKLDTNSNGIALSIDTEATTVNVIDVDSPLITDASIFEADPNALTTGEGIYINSSSTAITSGRLGRFTLASSVDGLAAKTGSLFEITASRTELGANATADNFDTLLLSRTNITATSGTMTSSGAILKIEGTATETAGTLADTTIALEIAHNSFAASKTYAVSITHNNAEAGGLAGGIDMSSFSVDEPVIKAVDDAITGAGTITKQIAVDIGGTIYYLIAYTHGS